VDFHATQFCSTDVFISLVVQVDETTFSWKRERAFQQGHLPKLYTGDFEPVEELLWVLLHNRPLSDMEPRFAIIVCPDYRARSVFWRAS
jgi:hypothetical protein